MTTRLDSSLSRRTFLRGAAGATLATPWLSSLPVRAETGKLQPATTAATPPKRFACIAFADGVSPQYWWAKGAGAQMELSESLQPMQPHRDDLLVLQGLFNERAYRHRNIHLGRFPNLLSGANVGETPGQLHVGKTVDQVLAEHLGKHTKLPSITLGIEPTELRLEDGLSMLYGSCISWVASNKPAAKEIYPSRAYDMIVGDGSQRQKDQSILDQVLADARAIQSRLDATDRQKLDEYLESIRDIEKRIDHASSERRLEGWRPTLDKPNMARPEERLPQNVPDHMKLMMDLIVLGFQMDKTRVATCLLNNDLSAMTFEFLDGVRGGLHADLSHHGNNPQAQKMYMKSNRYHVSQFAYLVDRLKRIDEGGSSIFDNSVLMCCSALWEGNVHDASQLPILVAGSGGGQLKTGQALNYFDRGDDHRRACSLYLSMLDCFGVELPRFGDADTRLADI